MLVYDKKDLYDPHLLGRFVSAERDIQVRAALVEGRQLVRQVGQLLVQGRVLLVHHLQLAPEKLELGLGSRLELGQSSRDVAEVGFGLLPLRSELDDLLVEGLGGFPALDELVGRLAVKNDFSLVARFHFTQKRPLERIGTQNLGQGC